MRCAKCGRFMGTDGPAWALKCACLMPCWRCGDTHAPEEGCGEVLVGDGLGKPITHPCGKCGGDKNLDCVFSTGMPDCDALRRWLAVTDMARLAAAIKADPVVGGRSCSRIAECVGFGKDLERELALAGCGTVKAAIEWARNDERLFLEQGLNQRWGESDDPQLAAMREFEAADKANPPGAPSRNDGLGLVWDDNKDR